MEVRNRISTSPTAPCGTEGTETTPCAVWSLPQLPVKTAVESSYCELPAWVPKANPGVVTTLHQSNPLVLPCSQRPDAISPLGKLVEYELAKTDPANSSSAI